MCVGAACVISAWGQWVMMIDLLDYLIMQCPTFLVGSYCTFWQPHIYLFSIQFL